MGLFDNNVFDKVDDRLCDAVSYATRIMTADRENHISEVLWVRSEDPHLRIVVVTDLAERARGQVVYTEVEGDMRVMRLHPADWRRIKDRVLEVPTAFVDLEPVMHRDGFGCIET